MSMQNLVNVERRPRRAYGGSGGYGFVPGYGFLPLAAILVLVAIAARNRRGDTNIVNVNSDEC